jgi:hypothetical protein
VAVGGGNRPTGKWDPHRLENNEEFRPRARVEGGVCRLLFACHAASLRAALAIINDGSVGDDATKEEFVGFSDEKLWDNINRWHFNETRGLLVAMPDGGEKMWICLNRMKKELERWEIVRWKKVRKDVFLFNCFRRP